MHITMTALALFVAGSCSAAGAQETGHLMITTCEVECVVRKDRVAAGYRVPILSGSLLQPFRRQEEVGRQEESIDVNVDRVYAPGLPPRTGEYFVTTIPANCVVKPIEAVRRFTERLAQTREDKDSLFGRANAYLALNQCEKSLADFNAAVALKPDDVTLLLRRSEVLRNLDRPHEALVDCQRVLSLQPDLQPALLNAARAQESLNRVQDGIESCSQILRNSPVERATLVYRALLKARSGDRSGAQADYQVWKKETSYRGFPRETLPPSGDRLIHVCLPIVEDNRTYAEQAVRQLPQRAESVFSAAAAPDFITDLNGLPCVLEYTLLRGVMASRADRPRLCIGVVSVLLEARLSPGFELLCRAEVALSHEKLGRFEDAIRVLEPAIPLATKIEESHTEDRDPEQTVAGLLRLQARCRLALNDFQAADADCTQVLTKAPLDPDALLTRCISRLRMKRTEAAQVDSEALMQAAPTDYRSHLARGLSLLQNGQPTEADAEFDKAVVLATEAEETRAVLILRAAMNLQQRRLDAAERDIAAALAISPKEVSLWILRSRIAEQAGNAEAALRQLDEAASLKDGGLAPAIHRAELLRRLKRPVDALAVYDRILWAEESNSVILRLRGAVYADLEKPDKAVIDFTEAIEHATTDAQRVSALYERARFSASRNNPQAALADLNQAIELVADDPQLFTFRAGVWRQLGDDAKANADNKTAKKLAKPE